MDIYDAISLGDFSVNSPSPNAKKTRRKYARIQMVHSGVLTPGIVLDNNSRYEVPFVLILEPLYLGVLPKSVVPVVLAIIVAIPLGLLIATKINSSLQDIMKDAKWDLVDQCKND
jgi:ABC-type phosphate/phosphonate transport system permease subunit